MKAEWGSKSWWRMLTPSAWFFGQITDTVYPMYKAFIEPDLATAHLKIYNTFNPFSGFMAPTYILKSAKSVSVDAIKSVLKVCKDLLTSQGLYLL